MIRVGSSSAPISLPFNWKSFAFRVHDPVGSPLAVSSPRAITRKSGLNRLIGSTALFRVLLYSALSAFSGSGKLTLNPSPAPVPVSSLNPLKYLNYELLLYADRKNAGPADF
jgi:hypothetical protein